MTTKKQAVKAICKADGCFSDAAVKGHCRLHFLKVLSGKQQKAQSKTDGEFAALPSMPKRLRIVDSVGNEFLPDAKIIESLHSLREFEEVDMDIAETDLDFVVNSSASKRKKAA